MAPHNDTAEPVPGMNEAGEKAWAEFRCHVEWPRGFALIFLFSSFPSVTGLFLKRLEAACAMRVSAVQRIAPGDAGKLAETVLHALRDPPRRYEDLKAPIWIEAAADVSSQWLDACDLMLARLNEYRDMLRARTRRPVIISLPGGYRRRARAIAPDLWAVRNYSLDLDDVRPLDPDDSPVRSESLPLEQPSPAVIRYAETVLEEWTRLTSQGAAGQETLRAGRQAAEAALTLGRLQQAFEIAGKVLAMSRQANASGRSEAVLRDLALSLGSVGDAALRLGNFRDARDAFQESLEICRALREQLGDTPETLRDLSVSLDKVGDAALRLGNFRDARDAFQESLEIRRTLREQLGDTPETLRDLSVSLNKVGDLALRLGNFQDARDAFQESLEIRRTLRERLGDAPGTLRDLSVSLNKVGDIALRLGNFQDARDAFQESLEIRRTLRERLGDTPETLRDLSVILNNVGDAALKLGNLMEAETAWNESLQLLRRLTSAFPENDEYRKALDEIERKLREPGKETPRET